MDFDNVYGYIDLNIPASTANVEILQRAIDYGYSGIALNTIIDISVDENKDRNTKKKKNNLDLVAPPQPLAEDCEQMLSNSKRKLNVFHRLTLIFSHQEQFSKIMHSPSLKNYNVLAALPLNQEAFIYACNSPRFDIVSYQQGLTEYRLMRKLYKHIVDRKGYFEIQYAPALRSSVLRQDTFTIAQRAHICGKSKNIIVASGARHYMEVRSPHDVANLCLLFGLTEEQAKCSVRNNCHFILLKNYGQRLMKKAPMILVVENDAEEKVNERVKTVTEGN